MKYLEDGDYVIATIRKDSLDLNNLKIKYPNKLFIQLMDIGSTKSVSDAFDNISSVVDHIDILVNNDVSVSEDCDKDFFDTNLDLISKTIDISAVGPLRVIQKFYPLLVNTDSMSLIINISSEAGSIRRCYRTNLIDYGMAKAALNMGTMNLVNVFKNNNKVNIFTIHSGVDPD